MHACVANAISPAKNKASLRRSDQRLYHAETLQTGLPHPSYPPPSRPVTAWQALANHSVQSVHAKHFGHQQKHPNARAPNGRAQSGLPAAHANPPREIPPPPHAAQKLSLPCLSSATRNCPTALHATCDRAKRQDAIDELPPVQLTHDQTPEKLDDTRRTQQQENDPTRKTRNPQKTPSG